jgi:type I restriction-modification system DNA methylase subunit
MTVYHNLISNHTSTQKSHHEAHLKTDKYQDKKKIKMLELERMTEDERKKEYGSSNVDEIIEALTNGISFVGSDTDITDTFSNRDAIKDEIHSIHNFIRNTGLGYGMNALKLFNLFYGLNKIENNLQKLGIEFKSSGLDECCKFTNIMKEFEEGDEEGLIYVRRKVLPSIYKVDNFKQMLFLILPDGIFANVLHTLLKKIKHLCNMEKQLNFQLSGKIYEYFIGRDQTAISELGAYFTDRHITNYIYHHILKPTLHDDGVVKTMIDPFAGSGGFTLGYIDYLTDKFGDTIEWKTQLNNIHHIDANPDVVKYAKLEFYCMSGEFSSSSNVDVHNAFTYDFNGNKFDYIVTNPPYGGDKIEDTETTKIYKDMKKEIENFFKQKFKLRSASKTSIAKLDLEDSKDKAKQRQYLKICKYLDDKEKESKSRTVSLTHTNNPRFLNYASEHNIDKSKCKDKESVSFLMMMEMLAPGGTAIGVLKEGLFFDSKYQHLRKHLVENFKVDKIVSIDASQFENTSTKTSIIQFHNTGKTEQIEFYDLVVTKDQKTDFMELEDGTYGLKGIKDRITDVSDKLITTASYDDIVKEDYTFNHKKYNKVELVPGDGFEMVQLGDICEFLPKSKRLASFSNDTGEYRFYSSGSKILKCDEADYKDKDILIIGHSGDGCMFIDNEFSTLLTNHLLYLNNKEKLQYLYYSLKTLWKEFYYSCYDGSTVKNTSDKNISKFNIPIPKEQKDIEYWVNHISQPYNKLQECKTKLQTLEDKVKLDIQNILDTNETEEVMLGELCNVITGKRIPKNKNFINYSQHYYVRVNDLKDNKIDINNIKYIDNETYKILEKYILKENDICFSIRGSIGIISFVYKKFNNTVYSENLVSIRRKNNSLHKYYLLYYLLISNKIYLNKITKSVLDKINKSDIEKFKIQLPKDRSILDTLNPTFEEIDLINAEIPKQEELYNSRLEELRKAAIKS